MIKYLAFEGGVMTTPDATVKIKEADYLAAIKAMQEGKVITIAGGFAIIDPPKPEEPATEGEGA